MSKNPKRKHTATTETKRAARTRSPRKTPTEPGTLARQVETPGETETTGSTGRLAMIKERVASKVSELLEKAKSFTSENPRSAAGASIALGALFMRRVLKR